jgi:hypothetical protein
MPAGLNYSKRSKSRDYRFLIYEVEEDFQRKLVLILKIKNIYS